MEITTKPVPGGTMHSVMVDGVRVGYWSPKNPTSVTLLWTISDSEKAAIRKTMDEVETFRECPP